MPTSVTLPALGESVSEGTVTRWLKQEGDQVEADEPLLEISTDKVDTEIPAPASGTLLSIKVAEDETVAVGAELAVIGDPSEAGGDGGQPAPSEQPAAEQLAAEQLAAEQPPAEQPAAEQPPAEQAATSGGGGGEATTVTMPALGESVTEGTITRWLKQEGDQVEADEPLLEISTDKVDTEIPAPTSGVLLSIKAREDETVQVGGELAVIGAPGGGQTSSAPAAAAAQPAPPQPAAPQPAAPPTSAAPTAGREQAQPAQSGRSDYSGTAPAPQPAAEAPPAAPSGDGRAAGSDASAYVTPLVRKLAAEHGVDLSTLSGSGVGGRIRKQDVLEAAKAAQAQPEPVQAAAPATPAAGPAQPAAAAAQPTPQVSPLRGKSEKMSRLRAVIAKRMVESLQTSAQLTTVVEVDVTNIARLRQRAKASFEAREGAKLSFLPFFAKAAVEALKAHPALNAAIDVEKGEVTYFDAEHLGVAVDTDRGLLVPVIRNAGDLNLGGIARKIADLAERTRSNKITPDELGGGTFTLTNTGSRGALFDTPIINQPQVGILGTGAVVKRPVVVTDPALGEVIAIRSMVYLALTYDHRLVDGADAARFLVSVKQRLEEGRFEAELGL